MRSAKIRRVIELARERGILHSQDLKKDGIPREYLKRLHDRGILQRTGRGLYILKDSALTQNLSLAEACKRVPHGVVCLLSALSFHQITTQSPFEVSIAIHNKARVPRVSDPPLKFTRFSGPAMTAGIEQHVSPDGIIRVFDPAKTVVDCFRFRNKIGLDVAMEALREARRQRKATTDELWKYARLLRVSTVMRPYLEAVV